MPPSLPPLRRAMILLEVFLLALAVVPVTVAQVANCTDGKFSWTYNSLNQCPCDIAMTLSQPCGGYTFGPLAPGQEYTPADVNDCTCNTVRYSLVSACAACQDRDWLPFLNYSQKCTQVFRLQYPETIPNTTRVPHWAYLPLANGTFDINAASSAGGTESTAVASATSTSASTSTSTSATSDLGSTRKPSDPTSTPGSSSSSSSKNNVGAIAGGVVGGIVGAALIAALAFWFYKQRKTPSISGQASTRGILASPPPTSWTPNSAPTMYQTPLRPYDPDDPSTFPPPRDQLMQMNQFSTSSLPNANQGQRYTGRPELF